MPIGKASEVTIVIKALNSMFFSVNAPGKPTREVLSSCTSYGAEKLRFRLGKAPAQRCGSGSEIGLESLYSSHLFSCECPASPATEKRRVLKQR